MSVENRTIYHGDVIDKLREMPDECVDCNHYQSSLLEFKIL